MKKVLIIALSAISVVGCKRSLEEGATTPQGGNEIKIGATQVSVTKAILDPQNAFDASSKIGVYNVKCADFKLGTWTPIQGAVAQTNVGYAYAGQSAGNNVPSYNWQAVNANVLMWQYTTPDDATTPDLPGVLVAYYPYQLNPTVTGSVIDFTLPQDQTTEANLRGADLMWAASTGKNGANYEELDPEYTAVNGQGLTKTNDSGSPINMNFNHMLSRLNFKIAVYKTLTANTTEDFKEAQIAEVRVEGPNVTTKGKLDLRAGKYTVTANAPQTIDYVTYVKPNTDFDFETIPLVGAKSAKEICNLIVQPATFTNVPSGNQLKFLVKYQYSSNGLTFTAKEKWYTYSLVTTDSFSNDATKNFDFIRNQSTTYNVSLNVQSGEIFVTSTIVPWVTTSHDINGN